MEYSTSHWNKLIESFIMSAKPKFKKYPRITKGVSKVVAQILRWNSVKIDEAWEKAQFFLDSPTLDNLVKFQQKNFPELHVHGVEKLPKWTGYFFCWNHPTWIPDGVCAFSVAHQFKQQGQEVKSLGTSEVQDIEWVVPVDVFNKGWEKIDKKDLFDNIILPHVLENKWIGMLFGAGRVAQQRHDEDILKYTWDKNDPELLVPLKQRKVKEFRHSYRYIQAARLLKVPIVHFYLDIEAPIEMYNDLWHKGVRWMVRRMRWLLNMGMHDYWDIHLYIRDPIQSDQVEDIFSSYGYKEWLSENEERDIFYKVAEQFRQYLLTGQMKKVS